MVRLRTTVSKNVKYHSIIEDYYRNGKRTTRTLVTLGNDNKISKLAQEEGIDVDTWLNKYLNEYRKSNGIDQKYKKVIIEKYSNKLIPKNKTNKFNVGYLFLEDIYYSLKLDKIVKNISKKYKFEFDLNKVLSYLVYSRIIYPSSKLKTYQLSKKFLETPDYQLENSYRGLTYLNNDLDYIQKELYNNSKSIVDRNTKIYYFDCTNYYFDINEEDDLRKYGKGKDHKPNPLVGMGLFMDEKSLPIAFSIFPGNENETKQLIPLQGKIIESFDLGLGFSAALFVLSLISFSTMIPSTSVFLGPYQYAYILALGIYNIPKSTALAVSTVHQAVLMVILTIIGGFYLMRFNISLDDIKILDKKA